MGDATIGDVVRAVANDYQVAGTKVTPGSKKDEKAEVLTQSLAGRPGCHMFSSRMMDLKHYPIISHQKSEDGTCLVTPARTMVVLDLKANKAGELKVVDPSGDQDVFKVTDRGLSQAVSAYAN